MKITRATCLALGAFVSAASCTQETAEPDIYEWADGKIYFRTSLSDIVSSRGADMTPESLGSFQVTCFNTGDIKGITDGVFNPYFEDATFIRKTSAAGTTYVSSPAEGPREWPSNSGVLSFFAFSPSLSVMASSLSGIPEPERVGYLNLTNSSATDGQSATIGYRLEKVRVNPDIAGQFDFITAKASGERWKDFSQGVELAFSHQMSQVELRAWGSGAVYDFEIAGVRIGNPAVEGDFIFADPTSPTGWKKTERPTTGKVEYLYRTAAASQPSAGDRIYSINHTEHNTAQAAESIMGLGGCAMVIPTVNSKWEGLEDPNITAPPYSTERMYFSILLRVKDSASGIMIYPYPDDPYGMKTEHYAVDRNGTIIARLFTGTEEGSYFRDEQLSIPYEATDGEEIKEFGWATVPVDADWAAGKRYVYTLNYSEGIGLHDPDDPEPGKPISGQATISWSVAVQGWDYAEKNDDYDPDIDVP